MEIEAKVTRIFNGRVWHPFDTEQVAVMRMETLKALHEGVPEKRE